MHNCTESCETSDPLKGLHFICYNCSAKTFASCAAKYQQEVVLILNALKVVDQDDNNKLTANVTTKTKTDFDLMFGINSPFGFECTQCKTSENNDIDGKTMQIIEQKEKIDELQKALDEKINIIHELTEEHENPNNITANGNDDFTPNDMNAWSQKLKKDIGKLITTELEKISDKVAIECKKVKLQCKKIQIEMEKNSNGNTNKQNPFRTNGNDMNTEWHNDEDGGDGQSNITFSENLRPLNFVSAAQPNTEREKELYILHISKFPKTTTIDDIQQHIMNNTDIVTHDSFKIEKLSKRESDYNSFKVSTLTYEKYDSIKNIWAPHFTARDFEDKHKPSPSNRALKFDMKRNDTPNVGNRRNTHNNYNYGKYYDRTPQRNAKQPKSPRYFDKIDRDPRKAKGNNGNGYSKRDNGNGYSNRDRGKFNEGRPEQTTSDTMKNRGQVPPTYYFVPIQQPLMQSSQPSQQPLMQQSQPGFLVNQQGQPLQNVYQMPETK